MRGDGDAGARVELHLPKCKSADSGGVRPRADSKTRQAVRGLWWPRPVPWFPMNRWIRKEARDGSLPRAPGWAHRLSPRGFFSLPRYGKWLDGVLYFLCLIRFVAPPPARVPVRGHRCALRLPGRPWRPRFSVSSLAAGVVVTPPWKYRPPLGLPTASPPASLGAASCGSGDRGERISQGCSGGAGGYRPVAYGSSRTAWIRRSFSAMDRREARRLCGPPRERTSAPDRRRGLHRQGPTYVSGSAAVLDGAISRNPVRDGGQSPSGGDV